MVPFQASADNLSTLKQQYSSLQQQQQQLQAQLNSQNSQVQTAQARQAAINAQIAVTQKQLALLTTQLNDTNAQVAGKQRDIDTLQKQIDQDYNLLKARLRAMYVSGNDSFLTVLLNSDGVSDFLNRIEMVKTVSKHDNELIADLLQQEEQIKKDKQALDEAQKELLQTQGTMAAKRDILNAQLAQQAQAVAQAQAQASATNQQAQAVSAQAAKTDAQINAEIATEAAKAKAKAEAEKAAAAKASASLPSSGAQTGGTSGSTSSSAGYNSASGFGTPSYVVSYAEQFNRYPYRLGTAGPDIFDCSGLVQYVFANAAGVSLPHSAAEQFSEGSPVSGQLQPGDLVFFRVNGGDIDHVGIYVGGGEMFNAENPNAGVKYDTISSGYWKARYAGARRIL